jgi:hypothetical protein
MRNYRKYFVSLVLTAALSACIPAEEASDTTVALEYGSEQPVALVEVALDSTSYIEVVDRLGTVPAGLVDLGPRSGAGADVRVELSPGTPTGLFAESVEAMGGAGPLPSDLEITFGTDEHAIGLLLPAVQNLTSLGTDTGADAKPTLFVAMQTDASTISDVQPLPEEAIVDSFFDIDYSLVATMSELPDATPDERALIDALPSPVPVQGNLVLVPSDGKLVLASEVALGTGDQRDLLDAAPRVSVAFDIRGGDLAPLQRIRVQGERAYGGAGLDILIGNTGGDHSASVITYTGLELASTDADGVRALFEAEYANYTIDGFGRAASLLQPIMDQLDTDPEAALLSWQENSSTLLGIYIDLLIDTVDREAMACSMGLPFVVEAGQAMDPSFELAAIVEEASTSGDIMSNFREQLAGGSDDIIFGGLGQDDVMDKPAVTCEAIIAMASALANDPVDGFDPAKRDALIDLGFAIDSSRAAYLTRLVIDFDEEMAAGAEISDLAASPWPAAAKTKACILIESLGNMAQAAADRHTVQIELVAMD